MAKRESEVAIFKKINSIKERLFICTEREEIDALFDSEGIGNLKERIELLDQCMGFEEMANTPEELPIEQEYDFECEMFVEGTWRMLS